MTSTGGLIDKLAAVRAFAAAWIDSQASVYALREQGFDMEHGIGGSWALLSN
jgi:hypothetical protein